MSLIKKTVESIIANNLVVVFSKSYCPYCVKAKSILTQSNIEFFSIELDKEDNGDEIQEYLKAKTNQRTVPNIFIKEKHIGGCSDLTALESSGELQKLF
ncbi:glutaredoxin 1 [Spinellus fusiger]|nr:glutaredoxin 1 [Spinellus fusiger]